MWLARSPLVDEGVVVRPDLVSLGVLVSAVPRDLVDEAVAVCGVREKRSDGKLPAHVITYLTLALCLFPALYIVCFGPVVVRIYHAFFEGQ